MERGELKLGDKVTHKTDEKKTVLLVSSVLDDGSVSLRDAFTYEFWGCAYPENLEKVED